MKAEEAKFGVWTPTQDANGFWNVPGATDKGEYTYAAVQLNSNINLNSDPHCSSAGCTQYKHPKSKDDHPVDYPVADFGKDHEMRHTDSSLDTAEKIVGHKWQWTKKEDEKIVNYNTNAPLDGDIQHSIKHLKNQEGVHGKWDLPTEDIQIATEAGSDPICNSAGCTQYKHPKKDRGYDIDYPVVNLGQDREISDHFTNLDMAEKIVGHHWDFKLEKPPLNPAKKTLYDYAPTLDKDMVTSAHSLELTEDRMNHKYADWMNLQTESDPVCSSAGCDQYKHKKKARGYDIDYPVPNLGVDRDIEGAHEDLAVAEKIVGHHLVMGTKESQAQWKNPAKKTMYDYAPKLDKDMRNTAGSIEQIEDRENHKFEPWNFVQTESDPVCSSAGCDQYKHKKKARGYDIDYPVPNLGVDRDIEGAHEDLAVAEKMIGHHLVMGTKES